MLSVFGQRFVKGWRVICVFGQRLVFLELNVLRLMSENARTGFVHLYLFRVSLKMLILDKKLIQPDDSFTHKMTTRL